MGEDRREWNRLYYNPNDTKCPFGDGFDTKSEKEMARHLIQQHYKKLYRYGSDYVNKIKRKAGEANTVFLDDPNAIPMMKKRIADLEKKRIYWKGIKKTVPRTYDSSLGDQRWYMLDNISTKLRTAKKKLEQLEQNKREGVKLQRNTTYKHGKPRFYYSSTKELLESLDNLIDESYATAAGTARGAHKAWLTRQHGADKAKRKKTTGLYSKPYTNWVHDNAADLQLTKSFRDKYSKKDKNGKPEWIAMSYIQSHHIARKKFA